MAAGDSKRDPLAIVIAAVSLVTQVGLWFMWGGNMEARMSAVEERTGKVETVQASSVLRDGEHDVKIAVSVQQQADIIARLTRIETKVEARR